MASPPAEEKSEETSRLSPYLKSARSGSAPERSQQVKSPTRKIDVWGTRPTDVLPFRAAKIVGARFAFLKTWGQAKRFLWFLIAKRNARKLPKTPHVKSTCGAPGAAPTQIFAETLPVGQLGFLG
jgi:hypothetical protein